ncbi:S1 RNA-binding domain-containing protein [Lactobacillus sp. ESL0684]|uniref:S1 RNA-binding domain-containing protein n=1 Tax=Lactobacillus sp. ESL0684 TaxID=2983213 RepID=UPI0023F86EC6|nr:S1 RNA-binding domain-containing protein [Lactobacillus sp. ESL0684]WEV44493.1 S1 RNA-binding domain-containing protein [Lactobacillus sp. ESL0684]
MMKYQVGQRLTGKINNITKLGIFITIADHQTGLIHHSDFGNNWLRESHNYQVGQTIRVVVLHNHHGKLALSKMRVNDPELLDPTNPFSSTKPADFQTVLTETLSAAKSETAKLTADLVKYAD